MARANFEPWGDVTDPTQHNPEQFRYLVHLDTGRNNHFIADDWSLAQSYFIDNPDAIT